MSATHAERDQPYALPVHRLPAGLPARARRSREGEIIEVRGNSCKKGEEFARQEHLDPRRLVTTTVAIDGARWPRLPVKTTGAVPKAMVRDVCRA